MTAPRDEYKCPECGKTGTREDRGAADCMPRGWYAIVVFHPWFDGSEGQVENYKFFCSIECLNAGIAKLPTLDNW